MHTVAMLRCMSTTLSMAKEVYHLGKMYFVSNVRMYLQPHVEL